MRNTGKQLCRFESHGYNFYNSLTHRVIQIRNISQLKYLWLFKVLENPENGEILRDENIEGREKYRWKMDSNLIGMSGFLCFRLEW